MGVDQVRELSRLLSGLKRRSGLSYAERYGGSLSWVGTSTAMSPASSSISGTPAEAAVRWTHEGNAVVSVGPVDAVLHRLDGTTRAVAAGDTITVTEEPVLIVRT
jgi:hypothetical protein